MKKKICLILMFFTLILLAGCSITREDQKGEKKTEKTRTPQKHSPSVSAPGTVSWILYLPAGLQHLEISNYFHRIQFR